jgi:alcohol dehydrogenase
MNAPQGEFRYIGPAKVIFGPGKTDALPAELERRGLSRAVVVTGNTLGHSPLLETVTGALGGRCAAVFSGIRQHVPLSAVRELQQVIQQVNADCLVSFGGGSPVDAAKVAAYSVLTGRDPGQPPPPPPYRPERELVNIAIPTTLSAAEYTPAGAFTDENTRVKSGVFADYLQPQVIINDPLVTLKTPNWLWVATAMRALDHAVESIYSLRHQAINDAVAAKAIVLLREHLPASRGIEPDHIAHRGYCQMAAWFSIFGAMNTGFGISHALGHQIGPRWNVPHGVTSCITLPHVMKYMAGIAPERFGPIAEGFGVAFDPSDPRPAALECAQRTTQFIAQFAVPHRLQDAGVPREEVGLIAGTVLEEVERFHMLDRPVSVQDITALLEAAY